MTLPLSLLVQKWLICSSRIVVRDFSSFCVLLLPGIFPHIPSCTRMVACCSVVHLWVTAAQQSSFPLVSSYFQKRKGFRLAHWSFSTSFWELLFGSFSLFLAHSHLGPPFAQHSKKYEYLMPLHLQQCEQSLGLLNFCYENVSLCGYVRDELNTQSKVSPFSALSLPHSFLMESPLEHKAADDDYRSLHNQPPISPSSEYQKLADLQWMGRKN